MEIGYWILKDKKPVKVDTVEEWGREFEKRDQRRVARDVVDGFLISTVFLGMDHNFSDEGPPLLFETMVFPEGGKMLEVYCDRYATWEEAEAGHRKAVSMVRLGQITKDDDNG